MSRFGNYYKDEIVRVIEGFAINYKEDHPDVSDSDLVTEIMEAVTAGLSEVLYKGE